MTKRKRSGSGPGAAIGGMLVGFDHQIFRTTPPPHELVLKGSRVRGLSGEPGEAAHPGELVVSLPDDDAVMMSEAGESADEAAGRAIRPADEAAGRAIRPNDPEAPVERPRD